MRRKDFLKIISTTPFFISMDAFSYLAGCTPSHQSKNLNTEEFASFGVVHLNNTSLAKAIDFWTNVIGLELRSSTNEMAEFGTIDQSLVVVHQSAKKPFQEGFSGLYHFAIHLPDKHAFAKSLYRLQEKKQAFSPVDHTMTQSLYLEDPDGITIELALETPERFKRVITKGGLRMEDTDGTIRAASAPLDIEATLRHLNNRDLSQPIHKDAKVGHIHFYANDVVKSNAFYKKLGFYEFNYLPQYKYADLGAGGIYQHRVAMNSWHGNNRPLAPANSAGLRYYQIVFKSEKNLNDLIPNLSNCEKINDGYKLSDPTGNIVHLTYAENQFENNLEYLIRQAPDSLTKAPVLILLHGYGSNEKDLFSFANQVPKDWLVFSVRGTIAQGGNRHCWYNVKLVNNKITINFEEEEDSRNAILNFIDYALQKYNGDENKVVLAGFSQGANMSLVSALTAPEKVAGFGMFSGRFVEEIKPLISTSPSLAKLKSFIAHGSGDTMLPIHYAEENRATLKRLGITVDYSEDATGHTISHKQFAEFLIWLQRF